MNIFYRLASKAFYSKLNSQYCRYNFHLYAFIYIHRNARQYSKWRLALIVFISIHFICLEINYNKKKIKRKKPPTLWYKIQQMTCSVYVYAYHLNILWTWTRTYSTILNFRFYIAMLYGIYYTNFRYKCL